MPAGPPPILELHDITKSFGGVEALRGVDFALIPGEMHGLVGANGAGKSTLMKILSGAHAADAGTLELSGATYQPSDPHDVANLHATILSALDIDPVKELMTPIGRPLRLSAGQPIAALLNP